ncbi:MAG: membrane-bound lytic murein transglycosylase MltF [Pseudomonadota bacterium]
MRKLLAFITSIILLGLFVAGGIFLYDKGKFDNHLLPTKTSGEIVVLTVNGPTTYFEDAAGQITGFEHNLAQLFADELGLKVRFEILANETEMIAALEARRGHIAAGTLSPTREREKRVRFGPSYMTITQQVVYHADDVKPRSIKDLARKRVGVLAHSHHAERLAALRKETQFLQWEEYDNESTDNLLGRLSDNDLDIVIADSNWINLSRNLYPDIDVAFDLDKQESLAWAFPFAGDDFLYNAAKKFFARIEQDGTLKRLINRDLSNTRRLLKVDMETFLERLGTVLPKYRPLFQEAQEITGLDWRLLAAISYHESHWDPLATSPTNVRGMMMLTEETADRLKVKNRLDPKESIIAGAKYLVLLKDGIPDRVPEPDRTWLTIAAYNQGLGHLEDARILTQRLKRNPDSWNDVKATMPLLADSAYYTELKRGYARGGEAVIMAETVRTYFDVLSRLEKPHKSMFELADEDDEKKSSPGLKMWSK